MSYTKILKKDPILKQLIQDFPPIELETKKPVLNQLYEAVIGQQLSTVAARSIKNKFKQHYGENFNDQMILDTPIETLRALGLSYAKANYIHHIAKFALEEKLKDEWFHDKTDEEIISKFTSIKGIGKWTVQMLLIFTLARENVFPVDDLGIQKAMIMFYELDGTNKIQLKKEMLSICEKWSPYKTYASLLLWKSLDQKKGEKNNLPS